MKVDERIAKLICELEYKIGNQTFNPNSYDEWTGYGREYKYPVTYCASEKDIINKKNIKTECLESIPPKCVRTMKYIFGSNHLYIGNGIVDVLEHLEAHYGIDFNQLEEQRYQKKLGIMQEMEYAIKNGLCVALLQGSYLVGVEIPEGEYVLINETDYIMEADIYYQNRFLDKIFTSNKEVSIKLKAGETLKVVSKMKIRK